MIEEYIGKIVIMEFSPSEDAIYSNNCRARATENYIVYLGDYEDNMLKYKIITDNSFSFTYDGFANYSEYQAEDIIYNFALDNYNKTTQELIQKYNDEFELTHINSIKRIKKLKMIFNASYYSEPAVYDEIRELENKIDELEQKINSRTYKLKKKLLRLINDDEHEENLDKLNDYYPVQLEEAREEYQKQRKKHRQYANDTEMKVKQGLAEFGIDTKEWW